jgi:cytochrome c oxidase subunit II
MAAPVRPRAKLLLLACTLALALPVAALAGNGGFAPVDPESENAEGITQNWWFVTGFILFIFVLVEGLLVAFAVRYRRRRRAREADGAQIHGSTRLELIWTAMPVVILAAIAAFVFVKLPGIEDVPSAATGDRLDITVTGRQFYWQYEYPNGVIAIDRLRAPEGRNVRLLVVAPSFDVIHSWWIPALGGKIDAIPGVENETWFRAERTGVFPGRCAELCGLKHARMLAEAEIMPAGEFDRWLADRREQQSFAPTELGDELWEGVCTKCHGPDGQGGFGPAIADSSLLQDASAVEQLLRDGQGEMPPVGRGWSDRQMEAMTDDLEQRFGDGN